MILYTGLLLVLIDRVLKFLFYNNADINHAFIAGSVIVVIISIVLVVLLENKFKIGRSTGWDIFILIGGISNLIDIIIFGGVLDYIPLFNFKLNFSDILITIGIGLLLIEIWRKKE